MRDLRTSILKINTVKAAATQGSLLVAEPFLTESYFNHSVIMLVDYNDGEEALGLVMNNATGHTLDEYLDGVAPQTDVPVYCGGPIGEDRMVFMHTLGETVFPGARLFAPGLYLGGDFETAIDYVNQGYPTEGFIRFFIGYSGWSAGQLNDEINEGVWAVTDAPAERDALLRLSADAYWHRTVRCMGDAYRPWRFFPRDPKAN